jgi:SAM-dependent methyltransferase
MDMEELSAKFDGIHGDLAGYHSGMLAEHGDTPGGVGWNGVEAQVRRFEQLVKVIDQPGGFSLNDVGSGYGALLDFLVSRYQDVTYAGWDVSGDMIAAARARYADQPNARFHVAGEPAEAADYGIASGIFSMRFGRSDAEWSEYVKAMLDVLDRTSRRGFAFNSLTIYSDAGRMRPELYYADPCALFDHCKRHYSRNVALLHDYDLYDFTILVRKHA